MNNVIENPETRRGYTGIVLDAYSYLLRTCVVHPLKEQYLDSVVRILPSILESTISRDIVRNCLVGISRCSANYFSKSDADALVMTLLNIMTREVVNPERENGFLKECSNAIHVFIGKREELDEQIASIYLRNIDFWFDLAFSAFEFLGDCIQTISLYAALLKRVQLIYQKLARQADVVSKRSSHDLAALASSLGLDFLGDDVPFFLPSLDRDEQLAFYRTQLVINVPVCEQVSEVIGVICEFASESYRIHQCIDVLDWVCHWCAAEIVEVKLPNRIRVHYSGWTVIRDQWLEIPSSKLARAFTFTRIDVSAELLESSQAWSGPVSEVMLSCELLNLYSMEYAQRLWAVLGERQATINCARWMNRKNLEGYL
eukprot:TRINITY_DN48538_c0_g1_i1.p1 TRINITY_DN48538_c0_g1~~TRINITY_DN48538_c0_g1_i1.p1  ORF type:complete len:404 (-),score=72.81 TRINITY_DN48538_c0_g1_i1:123-1238(-)